jgi:hypothetical protein
MQYTYCVCVVVQNCRPKYRSILEIRLHKKSCIAHTVCALLCLYHMYVMYTGEFFNRIFSSENFQIVKSHAESLANDGLDP